MKNLLVMEIGRWLNSDDVCVKSERTVYIIAEIEESENEHSILGDDTSAEECEEVSDSNRTYNLCELNIVVL